MPSGISIADRLARHGATHPLDQARSIIAASQGIDDRGFGTPDGPDRWLNAVDRAVAAHRALEHQRNRELDLGISL